MPIRDINQTVSALKQQTKKIAVQASNIDDSIRILNYNVSSLHRQGFEEFQKLSKNSQANAHSIEIAIATKLNEYGVEMSNALAQHTQHVTRLITNPTGRIEVLVSSSIYMAISHSLFCIAG